MLFYTIKIIENEIQEFFILGTITATEISFDASDVVKVKFKAKGGNFYVDYTGMSECFELPEQSFRSALPEEIYFENPFGEKPKYMGAFLHSGFQNQIDQEKINDFNTGLKEWQNAQQKVNSKYLIIKPL